MNESALTTKMVRWLNAQEGVVAWKIHGGPHQRAGIPDIIACQCIDIYEGVFGQFYGFEVKLPGKEKNLTKLQAATLEKIDNAGGRAHMVTSLKQIKELMDL